MNIKFKNKKIGIWGYGIVGQSAHRYFSLHTKQIQILSKTTIDIKDVPYTMQTPQSITQFFEHNDYVLISPGIPIHSYYPLYQDKIITELDIFHNYKPEYTIAITGTLGKTSLTHLLTTLLQTKEPDTIAAGNIGFAMLDAILKPHKNIVLELSSFQLQYSKSFYPDFAIISNFYANHLDHHKSIDEYLQAKLKIIAHQTKQKALLPYNLMHNIQKYIPLQKQWSFFTTKKPTSTTAHTVYFLENNTIYKQQHNTISLICNIQPYQHITFAENLLILIATLDIHNMPLETMQILLETKKQDHRLQYINTIHSSQFFNDSKSTVWQATLQAVQSMDNKPIKLFLGGVSKGTDRSELFKLLHNKTVQVYSFGKESHIITQLCKQHKIECYQADNLDTAFHACIQNIQQPSNILFSPAGASFDLFNNYKERGDYFVKLVKQYENMVKNIQAE
jgi:UDP-N-acetylmuramoylalanine--D-glutamate ligase